MENINEEREREREMVLCEIEKNEGQVIRASKLRQSSKTKYTSLASLHRTDQKASLF